MISYPLLKYPTVHPRYLHTKFHGNWFSCFSVTNLQTFHKNLKDLNIKYLPTFYYWPRSTVAGSTLVGTVVALRRGCRGCLEGRRTAGRRRDSGRRDSRCTAGTGQGSRMEGSRLEAGIAPDNNKII